MKCKDCVHVEVCRYYTNELAKANGIPLKVEEIEGLLECDDCEHFKDRSRFVELPCKMGDTVYFVFELSDGEVRIDPVKVCNYTIKTDKIKIHTSMGYFTETNLNKDVFLTREEAEKALKERENDAE